MKMPRGFVEVAPSCNHSPTAVQGDGGATETMTVADEAAGWAEAQRRIKTCRETRAEELDLGGLRLTRVPEEVYELGWLRRLYLGADAEGRKKLLFGLSKADQERCNALGTLPGALFEALGRLELLDLSNNWLKGLPAEIRSRPNITSLNLAWNRIGDDGVRTLANLINLTTLN